MAPGLSSEILATNGIRDDPLIRFHLLKSNKRTRKPEGVNETESLLRKLVQVPKEELAAEIAKEKTKPRKKQAAKRKKKS